MNPTIFDNMRLAMECIDGFSAKARKAFDESNAYDFEYNARTIKVYAIRLLAMATQWADKVEEDEAKEAAR